MALRMRHWVGMTLFGLALVAAWGLPPESLGRREQPLGPVEEARAAALETELRLDHEVVKRIRWNEAMSASVVSNGPTGITVDIAPEFERAEESMEGLTAELRAEESSLTPRAAEVALGFFVLPFDRAAVPGVWQPNHGLSDEVYVGVRDGTPYCYQAMAVSPGPWADGVLKRRRQATGSRVTTIPDNRLGLCRLYGKYGMAGSAVQEWIESGAATFGRQAGTRAGLLAFRSQFWNRRTGPLGVSVRGFQSQTVQVDQCVAGIADGCAEAVLELEPYTEAWGDETIMVSRSPVTSQGGNLYHSPFGAYDEYLLGDMEQALGPDAFRRFWTSDLPVPEAFEAAAGVGLGEWVAEWVGAIITPTRAGPGIPRWDFLLTLLAVSLFSGWAVGRSKKRSVA